MAQSAAQRLDGGAVPSPRGRWQQRDLIFTLRGSGFLISDKGRFSRKRVFNLTDVREPRPFTETSRKPLVFPRCWEKYPICHPETELPLVNTK